MDSSLIQTPVFVCNAQLIVAHVQMQVFVINFILVLLLYKSLFYMF